MTLPRPGLETTLRWARSLSGVVLFVFVLTHFVNHALVLVSLAAADAGQEWFFALWRHGLGTVALYGAFAVHLTVALVGVYRRRQWHLPAWHVSQLALGLVIPFLLIEHVVGTRLANDQFGVSDYYARVLYVLWVVSPGAGLQQAVLLGVAWVHGCVGIHYWLRIRPFYQPLKAWLLALAVLVPTLALLGATAGGQEVERLVSDPAARAAFLADHALPDAAENALMARWSNLGIAAYASLLGLVMLARGGRALQQRRRGIARVTYGGVKGRTVEVPLGLTILDASRSAGIPHASVCGGRGRCSTCRVEIDAAEDALTPADTEERKLLDRVGAARGVRLACQARLKGNVHVTLVMPSGATAQDARRRPSALSGREMQIAVLFVDLRDFTRFAESRLPYDVVFIVNRYFAAMGNAVERAGGRVDKFIGDGVMALFGVDGDLAEGCRQALAAARAMGTEIERLNAALAADLEAPLRIGVGIHAGPAIMGEMGYGRAAALTAIGDTVNVASRLEALTKVYQCELVVSAEVVGPAGIDLSSFPRHEIEVRGRRLPLVIHAVERLLALPVAEPAAPPSRRSRQASGSPA